MSFKEWIYSFKRTARVAIDSSLFAISLIISYKLRLEHDISTTTQSWYWLHQLPFVISFVVFLRTASLFLFQIYSKMWRYTEIGEIAELTKPIIFSSVVLSIPRIVGLSAHDHIFVIPISVIIIDSSLGLIFLSIARLLRKWQISYRTYRKRQKTSKLKSKKRTLMIGAGQAALELARKVLQHPELDIEIICALDDAQRKQNVKIINDIRVVGYINEIQYKIKEYNIEQIIIAIPSLQPKELRKIIEFCHITNLETKIIPGVDQLAEGKVTVEQLRKVSLEDLLGREPVDLSIPEVANFINNKKILITGAGGSIGSELTKQLVKCFSPEEIYILGRGENSIFQLMQELNRTTKIKFTPIICDIRNYKSLYQQMVKVSPDVVFHAAAHKHVPLMEVHPIEAYDNNVIGTKNVAEIAGMLNVGTFVNISTDKAVNPQSVLGFTKRFAELVVNSFAKKYPNTRYISVRFGNVIGSRGSVIPIWEMQLKNSSPITITDKNAFRYFMTLPESAQLVIKAGATGKSSEIMVLDMGSEVNIHDLAKDFIRLSGYDLDQIKINFTGLRAGEKLKEELVGYYEGTNTTKYKKILVINSNNPSIELINKAIEKLDRELNKKENESFRELLSEEVKKLNNIEKLIPV